MKFLRVRKSDVGGTRRTPQFPSDFCEHVLVKRAHANRRNTSRHTHTHERARARTRQRVDVRV